MQPLKCEMCGGNDLIKQNGVFVCQSCGTKYSVEDARKMMIEGTVTIDHSSELQNLYLLARRARIDNNSALAQSYYEQILIKDPNSWEASFYTTYFQSLNCKIAEISLSARRIDDCEETVFSLIKEFVPSISDQTAAVTEVSKHLMNISDLLFESSKDHLSEMDMSIQLDYLPEFINICALTRSIVYDGGDYIIDFFGETYGEIAAELWKVGIKQHEFYLKLFQRTSMIRPDNFDQEADTITEYNNKIAEYDSSFQIEQPNEARSSNPALSGIVIGIVLGIVLGIILNFCGFLGMTLGFALAFFLLFIGIFSINGGMICFSIALGVTLFIL